MLARGHSKRDVMRHLVAEAGLSASDATVLLQDVPDERSAPALASDAPSGGGVNMGAVLGLGLVIVGELVLPIDQPVFVLLGVVLVTVGLSWMFFTFGAWREQPVLDASSLPPLDAAAPGERCGRHPLLASRGACPRCGTWACRACAPAAGFPEQPCLVCERSRPYRLERVMRTARATTISVVVATTFLFAAGLWLFFRPALPMLSVPFLAAVLVSALVQGFSRSVWGALLFVVAAVPASAVLAWAIGGFLAVGFIPLTTAALGAVVAFASTQRGHQRALALAG